MTTDPVDAKTSRVTHRPELLTGAGGQHPKRKPLCERMSFCW